MTFRTLCYNWLELLLVPCAAQCFSTLLRSFFTPLPLPLSFLPPLPLQPLPSSWGLLRMFFVWTRQWYRYSYSDMIHATLPSKTKHWHCCSVAHQIKRKTNIFGPVRTKAKKRHQTLPDSWQIVWARQQNRALPEPKTNTGAQHNSESLILALTQHITATVLQQTNFTGRLTMVQILHRFLPVFTVMCDM